MASILAGRKLAQYDGGKRPKQNAQDSVSVSLSISPRGRKISSEVTPGHPVAPKSFRISLASLRDTVMKGVSLQCLPYFFAILRLVAC